MRVNRRRGQILTIMVSVAAVSFNDSVVWWAHNQDVKAGGRGLEPLVVQAPTTPALIMVTHHVEEVPVGFTHVLLLREGAVVAAGPVAETLTAENLSATFGMPIALTAEDGRFAARATA